VPEVSPVGIRFRLLGEVEADVDGRAVEVGHARQRCVLVALLVEANRMVPVEQLVERVWGDRPPQRARNTLSGYLSRLRQVFEPVADVEIGRGPGGYVMIVDPMAVDLHRFRHLVGQARAAEDAQDAEALFERALELWRGTAFGALDTPWLHTIREALDAQRLTAELDRNDLALDRGRHAALLDGLSAGAAGHPFDERLAGQFMLALYRCGRQVDALRHYEQVRLSLAEELGTDPSPPLRQLHQKILTADPALAAVPAATRSTPASKPAPRQLPADLPAFAGRAEQLAELDRLLAGAAWPAVAAGGTAGPSGGRSPAVVISALAGTAGVGKTALAVHWAHRVRGDFPDGQLYVNLRGFDPGGQAMGPAEAVRGFLAALEVSPQRIPIGLDAQAGLYRSLLAGRRMLVVLDNARDAEQVRPLLPGGPGCLVLVTSRNRLAGLVAVEGAHPLALDVLSVEEARQLLAARLGAERVAAEAPAVEDLVASCARLPLALAIVAARAATHPRFGLAALAAELRRARGGLGALAGGDDPHCDLRAVFSWSYRTLAPQAATLFRLLGIHPGPEVSTPAAASLAGLPVEQARALLADLARANLVTETTPGRYTFHDLLRAYATEQAHTHESDDERGAATRRLLDHYLHTAHTADRLLNPTRDPIALTAPRPGVTPEQPADQQQALAWFAAEHPVLLAAVDQAAATGFDTHTWQLAWTLVDFLDWRGLWHDWAATQQVAVAATRRLAEPLAQAHVHRILARAYTRLGRFDEAHTQLRHALDRYGQTGDQASMAHTHTNLAALSGAQGRHAEALDHAERALDLYRPTGHRRGQALALNSLGWCHARLGEYQQALTCCGQALALLQALGDDHGEATTWDSLGYAHHHLGDHQQAITCYQHALRLYRDLGDRYFEADTLSRLGDTHQSAGDPDAARDTWRHALTVLDDLDHPDADHVRTKLHHLDQPTPPEPRSTAR